MGSSHAHLGRNTGDAIGMQESLVRVALGSEQDLLASRVLPVQRILAGIGAAGAQGAIGAPCALSRTRPVAAYEHDHRHGFAATPVAPGMGRPSREEVVVALELVKRLSAWDPVLELHDHVDRTRLCLHLDGCVWADGLKALGLHALAAGAGAQEVMRGAPAGQAQARGRQRRLLAGV